MHPITVVAMLDRGAITSAGNHLNTLHRGDHVVTYTPDAECCKGNRVRLTWVHGQIFTLGIAETKPS